MMDLDSLVSLRAVDATGSVTGAAAALGFTPSAVSQQIKRLERQTGMLLLERVGRGVTLTHHGRFLVETSTDLFARMEEIESRLHGHAGAVAGRLRVNAFSTALRGLIAPVVRSLRHAHPDLTLTLSESEPWETIDLVAAGRADLGLVHNWGDVPLAIPEHVASTRVGLDRADVIVPRGHQLAGHSSVTPLDLVDEDWVATPEVTICRQWLTRMYAGTGHLPRVAHESGEFDTHLALVRAGLGIALVPQLGRAALDDDLVAVPVRDPMPTRAIVALHRRSMAESPAIGVTLAALAAPPADAGPAPCHRPR